MIGAGGIGCPLLQYLVASGVGLTHILDKDLVSRSNLARQILFAEKDIGLSKARVASDYLRPLNPHINVTYDTVHLTQANVIMYAQEYDILLECTDDIATKFMVNDAIRQYNKIGFIGGIGTVQGHILPINPENVCYRCLFFNPPKDVSNIPTCAESGVLSPLPGVIGTMMAYLTIYHLIHHIFHTTMLIIEPSSLQWRTIQINQRKGCLTCSKNTEKVNK